MIRGRCTNVWKNKKTKRIWTSKNHINWVRVLCGLWFALSCIELIYIFPSPENLIRGLDDDEVDFLDIVDKAKMDAEKKQQIEEDNELMEFRQRVATLQEKSMDQVRATLTIWSCIGHVNVYFIISSSI